MSELDRLHRKWLDAKANLAKTEQRLEQAQTELENATQARDIVVEVANALQATVHKQLSTVVSRALRAVFDDPYEFEIEFVRKNNRTNAILHFVRDGHAVDPLTASGGGVVDVASIALRLACLCLRRPVVRRVVVLDEPLKFVWAGGRERVAALLEALNKELGVQLILVTHESEFELGQVVEL